MLASSRSRRQLTGPRPALDLVIYVPRRNIAVASPYSPCVILRSSLLTGLAIPGDCISQYPSVTSSHLPVKKTPPTPSLPGSCDLPHVCFACRPDERLPGLQGRALW